MLCPGLFSTPPACRVLCPPPGMYLVGLCPAGVLFLSGAESLRLVSFSVGTLRFYFCFFLREDRYLLPRPTRAAFSGGALLPREGGRHLFFSTLLGSYPMFLSPSGYPSFIYSTALQSVVWPPHACYRYPNPSSPPVAYFVRSVGPVDGLISFLPLLPPLVCPDVP